MDDVVYYQDDRISVCVSSTSIVSTHEVISEKSRSTRPDHHRTRRVDLPVSIGLDPGTKRV